MSSVCTVRVSQFSSFFAEYTFDILVLPFNYILQLCSVHISDLNHNTVGKYLKYRIFQKILAMFKEKLRLLLPLVISFLLGFLLNSVLYILPDMMVSVRCLKIYLMIIMQTMKKMMMTPTLQSYQFFQFLVQICKLITFTPPGGKCDHFSKYSENEYTIIFFC